MEQVAEALATVHVGWVLGAVALALSSYLLRSLRWGYILEPVGTAPTAALMGCTAAGFAASSLLPARAGEVVRGLMISARAGLPAPSALASILTERLVDLATVLLLFAGATALAGDRVPEGSLHVLVPAAGISTAVLAAGTLITWLILRRRERAVERISRLVPARFQQRFFEILHHIMDGLEILRRPGAWWRLAAWSLAVWLAAAAHLIVLAWGLGIRLDPVQGILVMAVSIVGLGVPTPGGVGGFHAAVQFALINMLAVDAARATAFAILHHAVCFLPITVVGLAYLSRVGFSLRPPFQQQPDDVRQPVDPAAPER